MALSSSEALSVLQEHIHNFLQDYFFKRDPKFMRALLKLNLLLETQAVERKFVFIHKTHQ